MSDAPVDLAAARWGKETDPNKYKPRDALLAALRELDAGTIKPEHLIVVWGGDSQTGYLQGGSFNYHGRIGLLHRAANVMMEK